MTNDDLAADYLTRARKRLSAVEALWNEAAWADVVRESQEVVELALKGLLRSARILAPHNHDVSAVLVANRAALPAELSQHIDEFARISRSLRRDREMAFYGTEDLTPSTFYQKEDAQAARGQAQLVVALVFPVVVK
jgi:HEPN domain-containing protein